MALDCGSKPAICAGWNHGDHMARRGAFKMTPNVVGAAEIDDRVIFLLRSTNVERNGNC